MPRKVYREGYGIAVAYDDEDEECNQATDFANAVAKGIVFLVRVAIVIAGLALLALAGMVIEGVPPM
jgi:hypothetical protein